MECLGLDRPSAETSNTIAWVSGWGWRQEEVARRIGRVNDTAAEP